MTTQACNLAGRIPVGPICVQRFDGTSYFEADGQLVSRMIKAEVVEGKGPRSGRIDRLRVICSEAEAMDRMKAIALPKAPQESPGSITSMASREIYRETLGDSGLWCWNLKRNRNLCGAAA